MMGLLRRFLAIFREAEPAFHFGERVLVVGGFYKGQRGEVLGISEYFKPGQYAVSVDGHPFVKYFHADQLQLEAAE